MLVAMGMSAKVWHATEEQLAMCRADPRRADDLFPHFERATNALVHGARSLESYLNAHEGVAELRKLVGASDASWALPAAQVRALAAAPDAHPLRALLTDFPIESVHKVTIADLVASAAAAGCGLLFCVFEDY
jgi:hypothetical protein